MFQTSRPAGRIFYWALAVVLAAAYPAPRAASAAAQSGPALTSVIDTVYMANGTPAQGVLVITWPAFVAADGSSVAPGALNVTLGTNGALNVTLATNAGATPAGVYYTVVYQLQPSQVRTEYWVVPTTTPATLAQVRTTPGSGTAAQPVSMQYVDSALAAKANDNAVVHLAGAETVTGTKSFAVPPNVPTPVGTGDVTNKAYVDAAIATVGAGNYLPTAGGAMTGPLTLSASPTAPLQAAPKQYVDLAALAKANLVSGLVPTSELGSGTASALNCLLGSGAWGPCGSSANATAIQSVPVVSTAPANGQVLTYSSTSGQYAPATPTGGSGGVSVAPAVSQNVVQPGGTALTANNFNNIKYPVASYNWSQNPSGTIAAGSNTVSLTPCPIGLAVNTPIAAQTYVYISGVGTPEAALISSTTCTQGGGSNGTITFTAANVHGAGYAIGSASQGLQEAINAAPFVPNYTGGDSELGETVIPPAQYQLQARVTITSPFQVFDFAGSVVSCNMADTCIFVGSATSPTNTWNISIRNFTGQAGCVNCNYPMIEDAGQSIHFIDIRTANPYPYGTSSSGASFGSLIQVDGDEGAIIDNLSPIQGRWSHCTTSFCSVAIKGAGLPGGNGSGILWIKDSNLNLYCGANGIDNQNSNTMRISDSVVEAQAQFGVRATSTYGNVPAVELDNVYFEVAGCAGTNPLGIGQAGLIVENGWASVRDSVGPIGSAPVFANTGATQYNYYVVAHTTSGGGLVSAPFLAGIALTNGSGSIPVIWPQFGTSGTVTYDVIRTSGVANLPAPYTGICMGGSTTVCGSVATGLTVGSACAAVGSSNICSFTDTASTSTTSYAVGIPTYYVALPFWNGSVIYTLGYDSVGTSASPSGVHFDRMGDNVANLGTNPVSQMVSSFGALTPKFFAEDCNDLFGGSWQTCLEDSYGTAAGATVLQSGAYNAADNAGEKGRLIFEEGLTGLINGGQKITIADSNPAKTLASGGMRPGEDANDTYIGLDNSSQTNAGNAQLALGAPVAISNYIGSNPDNSSFLERLTASAKTFNVPVNINGNLTVTGTCTGCGGGGGAGTVNSGTAAQVALYPTNGPAVSGDSVLTDNGSMLSYTGSNGISAAAGTFSGNLTVNGQLLVAGPWMVSSPIPGAAMAAAGAGTSALGISNDGNFYISANSGAPQKVATTASSSYFSNLTQEDGYDVGQFVVGETTTTPQSLHVYSSYASSSSWQRTSLGYDLADNYAVVRSENSTAGTAPGLGLWINNGLKWVVDAGGNFKPWTDQIYNVGSFNGSSGIGLRPGTVYVAGNSTSGSGFELGKFASESYELCNDTTTGTIVNGLAVLTTAGCAIKPSSALSSGAIGVVIASAGTTGMATLARAGSASCSFDGNPTVIGDYVVASSTAVGTGPAFYPLCHDAGATRPTGVQILGRVLQPSAGGTTVQMFLDMPGSNVSSSGTSAGTGSCTGQAVTAVLTGGPTCTTITSAYVDSSIATSASAVLTGTPTAPTAATNTNTTQVATTAFVLGQASSTTPNVDGTAAVGVSNTYARADHVHPTDTSRIGGGGNLVSGNYPKANATGTVTDSGVTAGPYSIPWFTTNTTGTAITFSSTASKTELWGVVLTFPLTTTQVTYDVSTADNTSNTYDIGVLNSSGNVVAHIGSTAGTTFAASTGYKTLSWAATATLQPGKYYLAITSSCTSTCAQIYGGTSGGFTFLGGSSGTAESVSAGGTLNNGITIPADNPTEATIMAWEIH
jgi:hypothetical protein